MQTICLSCKKSFEINQKNRPFCPECLALPVEEKIARILVRPEIAAHHAYAFFHLSDTSHYVYFAHPRKGIEGCCCGPSYEPVEFTYHLATHLLETKPKLPCAVCGKPGVDDTRAKVRMRLDERFERLLSTPTDARDKVVNEIIEKLAWSGSFSVGGLEQFWNKFNGELCSPCKSKLDSIAEKKREAVRLLEEAIKLDPNNDAAKKNLEAVRSMV